MKRLSLNQIISIVFTVVAVLTPLAVMLGLLRFYFGASLTDLSPIWADEIWYWHQAITFEAAGFNGGYYTVNEVSAIFDFAHFNTWGLALPIFYGTLGRVFGWSLHAISLINIVCLTAALALFVWQVRPTILQSVFLTALLATFSPFIIYSSASLIQVLQQALAISLAMGFALMLRSDKNLSRSFHVLFVLLLVWASWVRLTWALLFLPYLILRLEQRSFKNIALSIIASILLFGLAALTFTTTGAPFPNFFSEVISTLSASPIDALTMLWGNVQNNIALISEGNILEIRLRQQVFALIGMTILLGLGLYLWNRQRGYSNKNLVWEILLYLFVLCGIIGLIFIIYDVKDWRDYRLLAPVLLMVLLIMIAQKRHIPVAIMILSMMWVLPDALDVYRIWTEWHVDPNKQIAYAESEATLAPLISYDETAASAWCNTVLHSHRYLFADIDVLLALDAGIGLSSPLHLDYEPPFRSRYLLLSDDDYERWADNLTVESITAVAGGTIWLNLESEC